MKKIILITLLVIVTTVSSQSKLKDSSKDTKRQWSNYQGNLNWKDAITRCKSLAMRLPTRAELKAAFDSEITSQWENVMYWTSEEFSAENAYYFDILYGFDSDIPKNDVIFVRCIR